MEIIINNSRILERIIALDYTGSMPRDIRLKILFELVEKHPDSHILLFGKKAYPLLNIRKNIITTLNKDQILSIITGIQALEGPSDPTSVAKILFELYGHYIERSKVIIVWNPPRRRRLEILLGLIFLNNLGIKPVMVLPTKNPPSWIWKPDVMNLVESINYLKPNMKIESLIQKVL